MMFEGTAEGPYGSFFVAAGSALPGEHGSFVTVGGGIVPGGFQSLVTVFHQGSGYFWL